MGLRPARRIAQSKLWKQIVGGFKKNYRGFNNSHWLGWCCCDSSRSGQKLPWSRVPPRPPPLSSSSLQNSSQPLWNDCKCQRFLWMRFVVSCRVCKAVWPAPVVAGTELADSSNLCSHLPGEKKTTLHKHQFCQTFKKGPFLYMQCGWGKIINWKCCRSLNHQLFSGKFRKKEFLQIWKENGEEMTWKPGAVALLPHKSQLQIDRGRPQIN